MALIGGPWALLVLRDLLNGVRRFDELAEHLRIARNVLTRRLAGLVEAGLARRVAYQEPGQRARHEYRPTQAGWGPRPVLVAVMAYGDRHLAGPEGPPVRVEHMACGARVRLRLECAAGHEIGPGERPRNRLGPGARPRSGETPVTG